MTARVRLAVDWTRCAGHGLCHAVAPEAVRRDEWGFPLLASTAEVELATARRLAAACPALALRVEPS